MKHCDIAVYPSGRIVSSSTCAGYGVEEVLNWPMQFHRGDGSTLMPAQLGKPSAVRKASGVTLYPGDTER